MFGEAQAPRVPAACVRSEATEIMPNIAIKRERSNETEMNQSYKRSCEIGEKRYSVENTTVVEIIRIVLWIKIAVGINSRAIGACD